MKTLDDLKGKLVEIIHPQWGLRIGKVTRVVSTKKEGLRAFTIENGVGDRYARVPAKCLKCVYWYGKRRSLDQFLGKET